MGMKRGGTGCCGSSWIRGYRQTRQEARRLGRSFAEHMKLSPNPDVKMKTVVSEDSVAVVGNALGIGATALQQLTDEPLWDGVAALIILAILVFVAFALARDNKDLLIGEAIEPAQEREVADFLRNDDRVKKVLNVMTMRLGAETVLVVARVDFVDGIDATELEHAAAQVECALRVVPGYRARLSGSQIGRGRFTRLNIVGAVGISHKCESPKQANARTRGGPLSGTLGLRGWRGWR